MTTSCTQGPPGPDTVRGRGSHFLPGLDGGRTASGLEATCPQEDLVDRVTEGSQQGSCLTSLPDRLPRDYSCPPTTTFRGPGRPPRIHAKGT